MALESLPHAGTLRVLPSTPATSGTLLELKGREPFGVGGRRLCFVHPHDPKKCVKVLRTDERRTVRHKKTIIPAHWRREYDNNAHERRILEDLEKRIGPMMGRHLPRSYGMAATDLGPGLVLDLVRDHDGGISRSIRELITTGYDLPKLKPSFLKFGDFLSNHLILTRSLLDHNLVVEMREDGPGPVFLIDGFGDPAWIPFSKWIPALGRAKVARRIEEAWQRFEKFAASGGVSEELRRTSSWDQGFLRHRG
jgi:PhoP regulatory network protein YrbL